MWSSVAAAAAAAAEGVDPFVAVPVEDYINVSLKLFEATIIKHCLKCTSQLNDHKPLELKFCFREKMSKFLFQNF